MTSCQLLVSDLRIWVHLGYSEQERASPQCISLEVILDFEALPSAVYNDKLSDTICYAEMTSIIQQQLKQHQPFQLIEHLTGCVYANVYRLLLQKNYDNVAITVKVKKLSPPVPSLHGGVVFSCNGTLSEGVKDDLYQHWVESWESSEAHTDSTL